MFNLLQFRALLATAQLGGLSRAAGHLNRSVSAISMTLKQLEERVGGPLFEGDRKSTLTPLGRFIVDETRPLLEHHDRIVSFHHFYFLYFHLLYLMSSNLLIWMNIFELIEIMDHFHVLLIHLYP